MPSRRAFEVNVRQEPDFFGDDELELLYIAKKLREALKIEELLTAEGLDYLVEPDKYKGGVIFFAERIGAFFYVRLDRLEAARELLRQHRYKPHEGES